MKILTVHNRYQQAGGEDKVFEAEYRLLVDQGHTVETLIFDNSNILSVSDRIGCALGLIYNFKSAALLRQKLRDFNPEVIHVHNFIAVASPSIFFVAQTFGIPVVVTLHNYRLLCPSATLFFDHGIYEKSIGKNLPFDAIRKGVYRNSRMETAAIGLSFGFHNLFGTWRSKVAKFVVLTNFALQKFRTSHIKIDPNQYVIKPNFVDDRGFGDAVRDNFFLFVGRLCEEKGIRTLLKAATRLHFKLVIVGDGPLKDLVLQHCRDYPNINYQGFLDNASVIRQMKSCRALIFPSEWYEGFPVSIAECFSTGTPVIASNIGSMSEIVEHMVNGLHYKVGNEADLIHQVMTLQNNPMLAETLGANARNTYLEKYTPRKNYEMLMDIYDSAVKEGKVKNTNSLLARPKETQNLKTQESVVPKISIGIPTFNGAKRISSALNSIYEQTYPNVEIIISDNCSSDNTNEVCTKFAKQHQEIKYYRQSSNIGVIPNFDFCISRATGKYFMWLADDDRIEPEVLHRYVSFLESNDDYCLVSGAICYWKGNTLDYIEAGFNLEGNQKVFRTLQYYYKVIYGGMFHGMMRTELGRRVPPLNVFGNDFHFVAGLAFLGRIKNFTFPAYHKQLGGISKDVNKCARSLGESKLASTVPHMKICTDAFSSIMNSSLFNSLGSFRRIPFAVLAFLSAFFCYYGRIFPLMIAGKCKRTIYRLFNIEDQGSLFKKRSLVHKVDNQFNI